MKLELVRFAGLLSLVLVALSTTVSLASSPDSSWIKSAASANMLEIKAGKLASQRSTSRDWKMFGIQMVNDHTKALTGIKSLAMDKSVTVSSRLAPPDAAAYAGLAAKHGMPFDKAYHAFAVKSHMQANSLYSKEIATGKDSDVRAVASKQLPTVQNHLSMADKMTGMGMSNMSTMK